MGTRAVSWLPWLILLFITASVSATPSKKISRLGVLRGSSLSVLEGSSSLRTVSVNLSENFQTFFYPQTLDHFNYRPESYTTFLHRYMVNFNYWGGVVPVVLLRSLFILVRNQTWTRISIQLDSSLRTVLGSALYWFILRFDLSSFFGFISNVGNA